MTQRRAKDALTITRPFAIFVEEAHDMPGTWTAHVVGHQLDNVTQGNSPEDAVFMAYDMLSLLTDYCTGDGGTAKHDYSFECTLDDGTPAWGCTTCGTRSAKDSLEEVP